MTRYSSAGFAVFAMFALCDVPHACQGFRDDVASALIGAFACCVRSRATNIEGCQSPSAIVSMIFPDPQGE